MNACRTASRSSVLRALRAGDARPCPRLDQAVCRFDDIEAPAPDGDQPLPGAMHDDAVRSTRPALRWHRDVQWSRESARRSQRPGRAALSSLLELVAGGCQSELEIWGVLHALPGPPHVPPYAQQHRVTLPDGRWMDLDAAWPEARVAVELDGAAFHGSREARERDLRRDTALAGAGWIVLRFSYARLVADPDGCRREIVAALRHRLATGGPR